MKRIAFWISIFLASTGTGVVYAENQPDLVITEVKWSPAKPVIGDAVTFSATVKNQGTAATQEGIEVAFLVDATLVSWSHNKATTFPPNSSRSLGANGGPSQSSTWQASAGTHTVVAWVDDSDRILESDENNNMLTATLTSETSSGGESRPAASTSSPAKTSAAPTPAAAVSKEPKPAGDLPDLIVMDVQWSSLEPVAGKPVLFTGTVKNQGTASTPINTAVSIAFSVDGTIVSYSSNLSPLLVPEAMSVQPADEGPNGVATWTATAGAHTVEAFVDDGNLITESDETNNKLSSNFTVAEAGAADAHPLKDKKIVAQTPDGRTLDMKFTKEGELETLNLSAPKKQDPPAAKAPAGDLPDLTVSSMRWSNPKPVPGDELTFTATVKNVGLGTTPAGTIVSVAFSVDGALVSWSNNLSPLLGPSTMSVQTANGGPSDSSSWKATAGTHTVEAFVDDGSLIQESNETNNKLTLQLTVEGGNAPATEPQTAPVNPAVAPGPKQPDLVVMNMSWSPTRPAIGDAVTFSANVRNQGTGETPIGALVTVGFFVDGTLVTWSNNLAPHLMPGSFSSQTANGGPNDSNSWIATAGEHTVEAFVDEDGLIPESDETNNKRTAKLTVRGTNPAPAP